MKNKPQHTNKLIDGLNASQTKAVQSPKSRILVIAGAGSGKTEVIARRIGYWVGVDDTPRDSIAAFTFTERAAEEMKFRVRRQIQAIFQEEGDATLAGMYVGTIHSFCLKQLRELEPDRYHNFDILDESARYALIQRGFNNILGLSALKQALGYGVYATIDYFVQAYDLLNEYGLLEVELSERDLPHHLNEEVSWCKEAKLVTPVGTDAVATCFSQAAARFYAYLLCRRFLDFSTSQAELVRLLEKDVSVLEKIQKKHSHIVVDEVQDINPIQSKLINLIVGESGKFTAVGDHRQAIYRFRGGRVELMQGLANHLNQQGADAAVIFLEENYRSTPRIIEIANNWADTIGEVEGLPNPHMKHARAERSDKDISHIQANRFNDRGEEASWIADSIRQLVNPKKKVGASHDSMSSERGIEYSDVVILLRSSTDARLYMRALESAGIPAVFRAGPDLFAQPEVLLILGVLGVCVDIDEFMGAAHGPVNFSEVVASN